MRAALERFSNPSPSLSPTPSPNPSPSPKPDPHPHPRPNPNPNQALERFYASASYAQLEGALQADEWLHGRMRSVQVTG